MDFNEWNKQIIAEFRANDGVVGGEFEGKPLVLLHTRGAKSGAERINPLMYLEDDGDVVVFASKGGMPTNPDWYYNLKAHPEVTFEQGTETHSATAVEVTGGERDRIYSEMASRYPQFAGYAESASSRTIPVIRLKRS